MKILKNIGLILFFTGIISAQNNEMNTATLMRYEEVPVDLSNGLPDINVPFVNLPTRSNDISVGISMNYHPLNSVAENATVSDCGKGWDFFAGGLIYRTLIETNDAISFASTTSSNGPQSNDIYQFNFMGYFGRFILMKKPDGTIGIKVLKQKNSKLNLEFLYNSQFEVTEFIFYDEKGYKYVFNVIANNKGYNNAYYLSSIIDTNNIELVHFDYETCIRPAVIGTTIQSITKKLKEISSPGFGKIILTYPNLSTNCNTARLSEIILKDVHNISVKKMKLFGTQNRINKIQISDIGEVKKEIYQFYYNTSDGPTNGSVYDYFGYKTDLACGAISQVIGKPSARYSKFGVLTKMVLPTGGTVVYDYESNTYSKYEKESDGVWNLDLNPDTYYECFNSASGLTGKIPLIEENFLVNDLGSCTFTNSNSVYNFTVSGSTPQVLYFKLYGEEYFTTPVHGSPDNPEPIPVSHFPSFQLKRLSDSYIIPHFEDASYYIDNVSGLCLGKMISLIPGNYSVTISSINNQNNVGTLEIKSRELNPNPRKWFYGGGIRIKQIGFFNNNAPENYYDSQYKDMYISQGYLPVREKIFEYNFFGTQNSSGYLASTDFSVINQDVDDFGGPKLYFGGYKNVTVKDSQSNGSEEYVFKDSLDPFDTEAVNANVVFEDNKRGLLLNKKIYDSTHQVLNSIEVNYDFNGPSSEGGLNTNYIFSSNTGAYPSSAATLLELGKITQKKTIDYYSSGLSKSVIEYYNYDDVVHQLKEHYTTNSLGESLKTEYTYDNNNSVFSKNRISEPLQTKIFRAGNLINTSKITYDNTWSGNESFQVKTIESARGNDNLEVRKRYNKYDEYSNLLEEQDENGIISSYIWGYNKTVIVAKLENIAYHNIPSNLIATIQSVSNSSTSTIIQMQQALDALRTTSNVNLSAAMITTFTYKPLVGILTKTDVKGYKINYYYDELGRLIQVRDQENNILNETVYNLNNQN